MQTLGILTSGMNIIIHLFICSGVLKGVIHIIIPYVNKGTALVKIGREAFADPGEVKDD